MSALRKIGYDDNFCDIESGIKSSATHYYLEAIDRHEFSKGV
jgi:hypothetical protein